MDSNIDDSTDPNQIKTNRYTLLPIFSKAILIDKYLLPFFWKNLDLSICQPATKKLSNKTAAYFTMIYSRKSMKIALENHWIVHRISLFVSYWTVSMKYLNNFCIIFFQMLSKHQSYRMCYFSFICSSCNTSSCSINHTFF